MSPNGGEQKSWRGITLFKIFGIRISLDFSWFIIFALVFFALSAGYMPRAFPGQTSQSYWVAGLIATLLFFASVMIHEIAHSLVAIHHGIDIPEITLFIFGGVSRLSQEPSDPQTEFKIAVVGPLTSFVLAAFFWGVGAAAEKFQPLPYRRGGGLPGLDQPDPGHFQPRPRLSPGRRAAAAGLFVVENGVPDPGHQGGLRFRQGLRGGHHDPGGPADFCG